MKIVTVGAKFLDIDGYGGCVAYAELLNLLGEEAFALGVGELNASVTPEIRRWKVNITFEHIPRIDDEFVLIDISDTNGINKNVVDFDQVVELIDHHAGFEQYWHNKIGDKAQIETVGAACTLVYERWVRAGLTDKINETTAKLLVAGILDNTLCLKAKITTARDIEAYKNLLKISGLPESWYKEYFGDCQSTILKDVKSALINDTKTVNYQFLSNVPVKVGQLTLLDAKKLILIDYNNIKQAMSEDNKYWYVNIISIDDGISYIFCDSARLQRNLSMLLGLNFSGSLAKTNRLWLRKEIFKQDANWEKKK